MNMETQRNPLLGLMGMGHFYQGKSVEDELRSSLWYTKLELEQTKMAAQEELRKRDDQLIHLNEMLAKATKERDEAHDKCQRLLLEKLLLHGQNSSGLSSVEDEPRGFSSSDCEESIVSSPAEPKRPPLPSLSDASVEILVEKPLPEKGKLLQAVMKAGPLLQTLLLAGPLPQWRHPPPPMESFEIPPVTIAPSPPALNHGYCGRVNRKRVNDEGSETPTEAKFQRVILH